MLGFVLVMLLGRWQRWTRSWRWMGATTMVSVVVVAIVIVIVIVIVLAAVVES